MDRKIFFNLIRPMFGGTIKSNDTIVGITAILDAAEEWKIQDPHHVANILANVMRETGRMMYPIKETVASYHTDKNPSDAEVMRRLDVAFAKGQLSWVKTPYWRAGWFGRGFVQLTHEANYKKMGDALGIDLAKNPDLVMEPRVSAAIAIVGMTVGLFTGKKLSDYTFPASLYASPDKNPRRIINGNDGTDGEVAGYHMGFYEALVAAKYGAAAIPTAPPPAPVAKRTRALVLAEMQTLLNELTAIGD